MLAHWRETCDERLAVEVGVAVLAAERAAAPRRSTRSTSSRARSTELLEDFAAYRQADVRLHVGLAEATGSPRLVRAMTEVQGAMTDLISLHRPPARGARLLQRPAPPAARRGARARRDARGARRWPSTCGAPSTCSPGLLPERLSGRRPRAGTGALAGRRPHACANSAGCS